MVMRRLLYLLFLLIPVTLLIACTDELPTGIQVGDGDIPQWLELPATDPADGLAFVSHDCTIGTGKMPNYSFYWDYTARVARWVAYPLSKTYLGNSGRSNAWGYDPLLPAARQQNVSGGYREGNNGWYTRGQQLPAEDRTANEELNATTFYGTNMVPQLDYFDNGVWHTLEEKVRSWVPESDILYVVSGCVVDGAEYYVLDRSGNRVTVPTAFFKAVLRYKPNNSTDGYDGYMGAAFWFEHNAYSSSSDIKGSSLSISDLEKKLGYELFVNLPTVVDNETAAKIKNENPATINWWWR